MKKNKLDLGVHVISQSERKRECVDIFQIKKGGPKFSKTFHQTRIGKEWVNNSQLN